MRAHARGNTTARPEALAGRALLRRACTQALLRRITTVANRKGVAAASSGTPTRNHHINPALNELAARPTVMEFARGRLWPRGFCGSSPPRSQLLTRHPPSGEPATLHAQTHRPPHHP